MSEHDPGDEDDVDTHPDKEWKFAIMGWLYREGPCIFVYPAERVPSEPEHDPGDEHPVMQIDRTFLRLLDEYFEEV